MILTVKRLCTAVLAVSLLFTLLACVNEKTAILRRLIKPGRALVTDLYTADPSAHVFEKKLYIYPSHDIETNTPDSNEGDQFAMQDYHVYSISDFNSPVTDHGEVLHLKDVPWAAKQLWAPDVAYKNGSYYLYFPAKDRGGIFRIGVARSDKPYGPFKAEAEPIAGSLSMDPAVFVDDNGSAYMYFGGLWGGQLERWKTGSYDPDGRIPSVADPALGPKFARMTDDMLQFDGPVDEIKIVDDNGNPIKSGDKYRWFFEAAWVHKYKKTYYLSYSTGPTHLIVYATSDKPEGPFTYRGVLLEPVTGWTTHHSTVQYQGKWYLFYHDSSLSKGKTHLRCVKYAVMKHNADGTISLTVK